MPIDTYLPARAVAAAHDLRAIRIDARADFLRRQRAIHERRRNVRVRGAGRLLGWSAGVAALLALLASAMVGLR